ncbi:DMT family transporter [Polycladidibacter hongkongensis]|uniref:DMT family transporter n=1 Tax=Polycladidibacter hongkongensis TaxID=1647556 RepID=UPI0008349E7D|nr:DMT family transporter [Pseudovibrio hongkongensis]
MHILFGNAVTCRVIASILFAGMLVLIKLLSGDASLGQIIFFRSAFALIPLCLFLALSRELPQGLHTRRPKDHIVRCSLGCIAMFTSFGGLKYLPLADATVIGYLTPILMAVMAGLFLGERLSLIRLTGISMGFAGVVTLVGPELSLTHTDNSYLFGAGLAFTTAVLAAGSMTQVRNLAKTEHPGAIAFYFALTCAIAGLATLPFGWPTPSLRDLLMLIGTGLIGGLAHIFMTLSLKLGEASKLATFEYLSLVFAVGADLLVFDKWPSLTFFPAATMIVGAALFVAYKERVKRAPV